MLDLKNFYCIFDHVRACFDRKLILPQISKIAKIIINRDYDAYKTKSRYADPIYEDNGISKTLLHLAAEGFKQRENLHIKTRKREFAEIASVLIERDPGLLYITTHPGKRKKMPVELALESFDDEMASLLMNKMGKKFRYVISSSIQSF